MKITPEEYLIARKKYLESLTDEEREEIENRIRKAHLEAQLEAEKRGEEFKKKYSHIIKIYESNLHHIKAIDILKDAIQTAIDNPAMTPELKSTGELFINLLELTGNSFEYDPDAVIGPVKEIVEKDTRSQSGKKAINERHDKPGGAREKKENMKKIWAKGEYLTHTACAENEGHKVGYSYESALKALRKAKAPSPWPAKEVKISKKRK